ncbi:MULTISPECIES: hypothetical protein [Bifidobacterium]|uniref:hypothetical protein n=1 Tax=Bifidobacterium TaxID=1678 RepID=UPI0018DE81F0|nr:MULTISPECIES: hypothetical protein [Bifidobacterium]MBH9980482.1 hypothetical protein [Bifidobacterium asteroides]MBI0099694.1 hypothetical protein [Bifidobacterium sp. W8114]
MDERQDDQYGLSSEQEDALGVLASADPHAGQSKWTILRQLPPDKRWPYFAQHFLPGILAAVLVLALVVSLVVTRLTRPPDPLISVQGFNMSAHEEGFDRLKQGFMRDRGIKDGRLVDMEATMTLNGQGYDDSAKALTRVSAGQINMVIAPVGIFPTLCKRGLVAKPSQGLKGDDLRRLAGQGVLVDSKGRQVSNPSHAMGLDLSRSSRWRQVPGLPDHAILGLSKVADTITYVRAFVDYMDFD